MKQKINEKTFVYMYQRVWVWVGAGVWMWGWGAQSLPSHPHPYPFNVEIFKYFRFDASIFTSTFIFSILLWLCIYLLAEDGMIKCPVQSCETTFQINDDDDSLSIELQNVIWDHVSKVHSYEFEQFVEKHSTKKLFMLREQKVRFLCLYFIQ